MRCPQWEQKFFPSILKENYIGKYTTKKFKKKIQDKRLKIN